MMRCFSAVDVLKEENIRWLKIPMYNCFWFMLMQIIHSSAKVNANIPLNLEKDDLSVVHYAI